MITHFDYLELPKSQTHKLDAFSFLNDDHKRSLLRNGQILNLNRNNYLFAEGDIADSFYLVLKGGIKLTKSYYQDSGPKPCIVDIVIPGEMIGSALMLDPIQQQKYPISALALGKTEVLQLAKVFYHEYWKKNPDLLNFSHRELVKRIKKLQQSQSIQRLPTEKKLAYLLTELIPSEKHFQITRKELGAYVGTTTESVIRILSKWTKAHLISTEKKQIIINSKEALRRIWQAPE